MQQNLQECKPYLNKRTGLYKPPKITSHHNFNLNEKQRSVGFGLFQFFFNWGWGEKTSKKRKDTEEVSAATEQCGVKRMVIYSKNGSFINLHMPELLRKESYRCKQPHSYMFNGKTLFTGHLNVLQFVKTFTASISLELSIYSN